MCCTCNPTTLSNKVPATTFAHPFSLQCGCGCFGKEITEMGLNRYREHLKAELKHIETRISSLEGENQ